MLRPRRFFHSLPVLFGSIFAFFHVLGLPLQERVPNTCELTFIADESHSKPFGDVALLHNVSGSENTAVGASGLLNCSGSNNTALGSLANRKATTDKTD